MMGDKYAFFDSMNKEWKDVIDRMRKTEQANHLERLQKSKKRGRRQKKRQQRKAPENRQ